MFLTNPPCSRKYITLHYITLHYIIVTLGKAHLIYQSVTEKRVVGPLSSGRSFNPPDMNTSTPAPTPRCKYTTGTSSLHRAPQAPRTDPVHYFHLVSEDLGLMFSCAPLRTRDQPIFATVHTHPLHLNLRGSSLCRGPAPHRSNGPSESLGGPPPSLYHSARAGGTCSRPSVQGPTI